MPTFYNDMRVARLLQSIPAGVVIHGADTEVLFANQQAGKILGLSADQLMEMVAPDPGWKFVDENNRPLNIDQYPVNMVLNSKTSLENYVVGVTHRLPERWAICHGLIDVDDQGDVKGAVICFVDVSELKQQKLELSLSDKRYRRTRLPASAQI